MQRTVTATTTWIVAVGLNQGFGKAAQFKLLVILVMLFYTSLSMFYLCSLINNFFLLKLFFLFVSCLFGFSNSKGNAPNL